MHRYRRLSTYQKAPVMNSSKRSTTSHTPLDAKAAQLTALQKSVGVSCRELVQAMEDLVKAFRHARKSYEALLTKSSGLVCLQPSTSRSTKTRKASRSRSSSTARTPGTSSG